LTDIILFPLRFDNYEKSNKPCQALTGNVWNEPWQTKRSFRS